MRLRAPGEPPVPLPDLPETAGQQPYTPTEVHSVAAAPRSTPSSVIYPRDDDDVEEVLSAGGDVASPSSAEAVNTPAVPAFRRMLSKPTTSEQRQRGDTYLALAWRDLSAEGSGAWERD